MASIRLSYENAVSTTAKTAASIAFTGVFIPPFFLFLAGIESGMSYIDLLYPQPQAREPLYKHPVLIYWHMYANILALGLHIALLWLHPPRITITLHSRLAWLYTSLVVSGTVSSIRYALFQSYGNDHGKSGTIAFGVMAIATFYTLASTLFYAVVLKNVVLHREWALRSFAVLFGNGVVFRVLANTYLVWTQKLGADFYASWVQMIYLSWIIPLALTEQYLSWQRADHRAEPEVSLRKTHRS